MRLISLLNQYQHFPGFVTEAARHCADSQAIEIPVRPRRGSKPVCSGCHQPAPGDDHLGQRRFEFVPLWGFMVVFLYTMRRVNCPACSVRVEEVPWGIGKHQLTKPYMLFLAHWARKLSWQEAAASFRTPWDKVFQSVEYVVKWGLEHRQLGSIAAIGVDEIAFVCSDMWQPYLKVIRERCSQAIHILDRFHIVARMNDAVDEIRAGEARRLARGGYEPVLKKTRWCVLKRRANLTDGQRFRLRELLRYNLQTVRAYLLLLAAPTRG